MSAPRTGALPPPAPTLLGLGGSCLGYDDGDPYWNDIVFGAVTGLIALARVTGAYRASWLNWINVLVGVWIFASGFGLDDTGVAATNDIVVGTIVFVLAIAGAGGRSADTSSYSPPMAGDPLGGRESRPPPGIPR